MPKHNIARDPARDQIINWIPVMQGFFQFHSMFHKFFNNGLNLLKFRVLFIDITFTDVGLFYNTHAVQYNCDM